MHRLIFWGIIILLVVLLFFFIGFILYWLFRIFLAKPEARLVSGCIMGFLTLIIVVGGWWGSTHTRLEIQVNQVEVPSPRLPEAFEGFRIAQLSDMHLGSFQPKEGREFLARLADSIAAQQPDIIVFTGDLVTLRSAEALPFRQSLHQLAHIPARDGQGFIPVYSILGNHDYAEYVRTFTDERRKQDVDSLILLQKEAGWHMLLNESETLTRPCSDTTEQRIALVGVENIGEPPFSTYGDLDRAYDNIGGIQPNVGTFIILLSHNPTHWRSEVLERTYIDLTLSGHTHAMQFVIGGWSPSKWKYPEFMGLYKENSSVAQEDQELMQCYSTTLPQYLYVNTGIGCVGPSIRIGVKPEVTILTLTNSKD